MYMEKNIPGKGIGCVTTREIKKGTLVLREYPQLLAPEDDDSVTDKEQAESIIEAFLEMPDVEQERYLQLHNMYLEFDDNDVLKKWTEGMKQRALSLFQRTDNMTFPNITSNKAFEVWAIYTTNFFHNGVCIKMSRFNHCCRPNATYFWNFDTNTRDLRTLRKIKELEEITLTYIDTTETREGRQSLLKDRYNFDCNCEGCDLNEEEIQKEIKDVNEYKEEKRRQQEARQMSRTDSITPDERAVHMQREQECLMQMYQLAKDTKTVSWRNLLTEVVEPAFEVSCKGALEQSWNNMTDPQTASWMKDAKQFAEIGLKIAKTLNGDDHSVTKEWIKRSADPIQSWMLR